MIMAWACRDEAAMPDAGLSGAHDSLCAPNEAPSLALLAGKGASRVVRPRERGFAGGQASRAGLRGWSGLATAGFAGCQASSGTRVGVDLVSVCLRKNAGWANLM
jgi:hypothetical protein